MLKFMTDALLNGSGYLMFGLTWLFFYGLVYTLNWPDTKRLSPPQLADYTLP